MRQARHAGTPLYNLILPVWLVWIWPLFWLIVLPANFGVDSLVLLLGAKRIGIAERKALWKRSILRVWLMGFLADFIAMIPLLGALLIDGAAPADSAFFLWWREHIVDVITFNPFSGVAGFLYVTFCVALGGLLVYLFNRRFCYNKTELSQGEKERLARIMGVVTAPWLFYLPTMWFYY